MSFLTHALARTGGALLILAAIFALPSCGYHFGASGTNLPAEAHTIYVARFSNKSSAEGPSCALSTQ